MIWYLTYNDTPSGIYSSQVIDVVNFIKENSRQNIKLIALISIRGYFANRNKIKYSLKDAVIIPMFPKLKFWRYNAITLKFISIFYKPHAIIGRSVIACLLAKRICPKNTVYDGRGAITSEWSEYNVVSDAKLLKEIRTMELEAIINSKYRIAVSNKLIQLWQSEFNYRENKHTVIPCTVNKVFENLILDESNLIELRTKLGLTKNDVLFIYSGSTAGWQSLKEVVSFITPLLKSDFKNKIMFLGAKSNELKQLEQLFNNQVLFFNVKPAEVPSYLMLGDYGLLIREKSVTNKVASPVKFAEYLACGLKVIISEDLGDYTDFVVKNQCGYVLNNDTQLAFEVQSIGSKLRNRNLAITHFTKGAHKSSYFDVLHNLTN